MERLMSFMRGRPADESAVGWAAQDVVLKAVHVKRMEVGQLAAALLHSPKGAVGLLDIRDKDYPEGHLRGAVNVPAPLDKWEDANYVDSVIDEHVSGHLSVVVYCDKASNDLYAEWVAGKILERLKARGGAVQELPSVIALRGGYRKFYQHFRTMPALLSGVGQKTAVVYVVQD